MAKVLEFASKITEGWPKLFYKIDDRDNIKPGRKFAEWEVKGIPIRIEIGPRDVDNNEVIVVRRDTSEKTPLKTDNLLEHIEATLDQMQQGLFDAANKRLEDNTHTTDDFADYKKRVKEGGFFRIHWCGQNQCETRLQEQTKSTIRCIPLDAEVESGNCIVCGNESKRRVIAAQSY